jgi:hypothetical protein
MVLNRDVVLIIAGAIFVLLSLLGQMNIYKLTEIQLKLPIRIIIFLLGMVLLGFGIFNPDSIFKGRNPRGIVDVKPDIPTMPQPQTKPSHPPTSLNKDDLNSNTGVTILQPENGAVITTEGDALGTYDSSITEDIWVFVWPEKAPGKGWPQSDDASQGLSCSKQNGAWSVHCYYGGPAQSYEVAVYTASESASKIIAANLKSWFSMNDYKGILKANMPNGLQEHMRIKVRKG